MEPLGNYFTFRNRPWNRPRKVLIPWKEPKKELVKVLYPKKGTEEGTGEGSWLWLSLKRPIKIGFEEPLRSSYRILSRSQTLGNSRLWSEDSFLQLLAYAGTSIAPAILLFFAETNSYTSLQLPKRTSCILRRHYSHPGGSNKASGLQLFLFPKDLQNLVA